MDTTVASKTPVGRTMLRLFHIDRIAIREYRAYRAFTTLTQEQRRRACEH